MILVSVSLNKAIVIPKSLIIFLDCKMLSICYFKMFFFPDNPAVWAGLMAAGQVENTASYITEIPAKCTERDVTFVASVKSKSKYPLLQVRTVMLASCCEHMRYRNRSASVVRTSRSFYTQFIKLENTQNKTDFSHTYVNCDICLCSCSI